MFAKSILIVSLVTISARAAKTDLAGCSLTVVPLLTEIVTTTGQDGVVGSFGNYAYTTFQWDGTEQCQLIDCGGGRAPPKSTVPGCPLYTGADTVPSLPFPTASLTLAAAAASTPAPAPASSAAAAAPPAAASPAGTSSAPVPTTTAATAPLTTDPAASVSSTPSTTVASSSPSDSASAAADLNPTTTSNGATTVSGRDGVLLGFAAVAAAMALS